MRRSLLIGAGVIAGAMVIGGGGVLWLTTLLAAETTPTVAQLSQTPADRYHSRGLVPLEVDAEVGPLEVYFVQPDATLLPPPGGLRHDAWDLMRQIMTPERAAAALTTYKVGNAPTSDRIAWVVAHQRDHDEWILGVNLSKAEDQTALAAALVHEYGHLIAFREGQLVPAGDGCTTLELPEGCARPGGYLHEFYTAFWEDYGIDAPNPANLSATGAMYLYEAYPGAFVSQYAALNIAEDFSESFAAYVHTDGEITAEAYGGKLAFFDRYEEMVQIRDGIRERLDGTLGTLITE